MAKIYSVASNHIVAFPQRSAVVTITRPSAQLADTLWFLPATGTGRWLRDLSRHYWREPFPSNEILWRKLEHAMIVHATFVSLYWLLLKLATLSLFNTSNCSVLATLWQDLSTYSCLLHGRCSDSTLVEDQPSYIICSTEYIHPPWSLQFPITKRPTTTFECIETASFCVQVSIVQYHYHSFDDCIHHSSDKVNKNQCRLSFSRAWE